MLKTPIPFVDLRGKTLPDLLRSYPDKAQALIRAARRTFGVFSQAVSAVALPLADRRSKAWLKRTKNPYLHEIESFADILETRGIYALNLSYEWGCTSGAYHTDAGVSLLRVLDWPFPALGQQAMVVRQQAKAGEYYNVTWPGMSGIFNAMAPGRFSAALNQAPMRRHNLTFPGDWLKNRMIVDKENGMPPAHLLRKTFDEAIDYGAAQQMLLTTPLAMPAIFILTGIKPGEGCIIERLENAAEIRELGAGQGITASNHFASQFSHFGNGWRPRGENSAGRYRQGCAIQGHELEQPNFDWLRGPIINSLTRLAVIADAATGRLMAQGYEGAATVTELFELSGESYAKRHYN